MPLPQFCLAVPLLLTHPPRFLPSLRCLAGAAPPLRRGWPFAGGGGDGGRDSASLGAVLNPPVPPPPPPQAPHPNHSTTPPPFCCFFGRPCSRRSGGAALMVPCLNQLNSNTEPACNPYTEENRAPIYKKNNSALLGCCCCWAEDQVKSQRVGVRGGGRWRRRAASLAAPHMRLRARPAGPRREGVSLSLSLCASPSLGEVTARKLARWWCVHDVC